MNNIKEQPMLVTDEQLDTICEHIVVGKFESDYTTDTPANRKRFKEDKEMCILGAEQLRDTYEVELTRLSNLLAESALGNILLKKYLQHLFDSYADEWTNAEIERFEKVMNGENPF